MSLDRLAEEQIATGFGALDRLAVQKLRPVRFGSYNSAERLMRGIEHALDNGRPISEAQRISMYRICWRHRSQLKDWPFMARVLIATALIDELADIDWREHVRPRVRAWRSDGSTVDRKPADDLFASARL
jgi:hypothetical protein